MAIRKHALGAACAVLLGTPALAQQPEVSRYEDWAFVCEAGNPYCMIQQVLLNPRTGKPMLVVMIAFNEQHRAEPLLAFNLPKSVPRDGVVSFQVDGGDQRGLPVLACNDVMCTALGKLPAEVAGEFRKGGTATVTVPLPDGRRIALTVSLSGFTAAYDALAERNR